MKKGLNIVLIVVMVLSIVFHFLVTQTDYISQLFGIKLNQREVMVATKVINEGDELTSDKITLKYIDTNLILTNPNNKDDANYVFKSTDELSQGLVATQRIVPGEQITKDKVESTIDASNPKKLMYAITVDYLSTVGNSLYVGDKPILWHSWTSGSGQGAEKYTEKVFSVPVEILALKDGNGNLINTDRTQAAIIPSVAIIRVDESDIVKLEECMGQTGNKFFFVKEISAQQ